MFDENTFCLRVGEESLEVREVRSCHYAVGKSYSFEMVVFAREALGDVLGQDACLWFEEGQYFHGYVRKLVFEKYTLEGFYYRLRLASPLHRLAGKARYRIFEKQSVVEVVKVILKSMPVIFHLEKRYPKLASITQFEETDLYFFQRLLAMGGLFYGWRQNANRWQLMVTDNVQKLAKEVVNLRDVDVLALRKVQYLRSGKSVVNEHQDVVPEIALIRDSQSAAKLPVMGERYHYGEGHSDFVQASQRAWVRQQSVEVGRRVYYVRTLVAGIALGQCTRIVGCPMLRVVAITYAGSSHGSMRQVYRLTLIPADLAFVLPIIEKRVYGLQTAVVYGEKSDVAHLDTEGQYVLQHVSAEKNYDKNHHVPHLQTLTHCAGGYHFPIYPKTKVAVWYRYFDRNRPVLLGSLEDVQNATQHVMCSHAGHQFMIDDHKKKMVISTAEGHQHITLEHTGRIDIVNQAGHMKMQSAHNIRLKSMEDQRIQVGRDHCVTIQKECTLKTHKGDIALQSGNELRLRAGQSIHLSGADISLKSMTGIYCQAEKNLSAYSNTLFLTGQSLETKADQLFLKGNITITVGASRLIVQAGAAVFSGTNISCISS